MKTLLCLSSICVVMAQPLTASVISGTVATAGRADEGAVTVVYAERLDEIAPVPSQTYSISQRNKVFSPRVLAVPVGSTVDFPNDDRIFHNVFSLSRPAPFDFGLYRVGESKSRTFDTPAIHRVFCNIHPQMSAIVLTLPTPYFTQADTSGAYQLDVPAGRYRITAWSERSAPVTTEVTVADTALTVSALRLDESQFVQVQHLNKFGRQYVSMVYEPLRDAHVQ